VKRKSFEISGENARGTKPLQALRPPTIAKNLAYLNIVWIFDIDGENGCHNSSLFFLLK